MWTSKPLFQVNQYIFNGYFCNFPIKWWPSWILPCWQPQTGQQPFFGHICLLWPEIHGYSHKKYQNSPWVSEYITFQTPIQPTPKLTENVEFRERKCGKIILVLVYVFTFGLVEVDYFVSVYHCALKKHYATSFLSSLGFMETHIPQISEFREFWGWVHY